MPSDKDTPKIDDYIDPRTWADGSGGSGDK